MNSRFRDLPKGEVIPAGAMMQDLEDPKQWHPVPSYMIEGGLINSEALRRRVIVPVGESEEIRLVQLELAEGLSSAHPYRGKDVA